jgi:hypothetical protein
MNRFVYLNKLKYNREELLDIAKNINPIFWEKWITPKGQISPYTQVKYKNIKNNSSIIKIIDQFDFPINREKILILKYDPNVILPPHMDWVNACAILIGLNENSHIEFWQKGVSEKVYYTYPILANLEKRHSVNNDSNQDRYVLKIPTTESFYRITEKIKDLYDGPTM